MKTARLMDGRTARSLQLEWLFAELEPVSDYGRRLYEELEPFVPGSEAAAAAAAGRTYAVAQTLQESHVDALRETLRAAPDATGAIARAGMGEGLADVNLLEVQRFCETIERVRAFADALEDATPPDCSAVAAVLERGRSGSFGFYLDDAFDSDLATARTVLHGAQAGYDAALGRLRARVAGALSRSEVAAGEFIVMRDDLRGPLPPGIHIIREAPTYYLCEIDLDEGALTALKARDDAAERVADLEAVVRAAVSAQVRAHAPTLEHAALALGRVDVLVAAVRFTQRYACRPAVYVNKAAVEFADAHFLPLQAELERQGRPYVPISLQLAGPAVVTGPNMGGKSVALRTCGFIAACAAFGVPVPARSASTALFARIEWLGIGAGEESGTLLSSFAAEVVRLRDVLEADATPALLLIDEFARTTTPEEGRALLLALIGRLRERAVCAFVATHLSGIAADARVAHFAVRGLRERPQNAGSESLEDALARLGASMDYTVARADENPARNSDAIFLAGMLGLDAALIESAWQWIR